MSYEWPVDVDNLFSERYPQMIKVGVPAQDVDAVRAAITEMWPDAPGGWVYEWSALAARYAAAGAHQLAALAYGYAKFPTLADTAKRVAFAHQLEQYLLAARGSGWTSTDGYCNCPTRVATPKSRSIFWPRPVCLRMRRCYSSAAGSTPGRWICTGCSC
jgi:hypothetical protein